MEILSSLLPELVTPEEEEEEDDDDDEEEEEEEEEELIVEPVVFDWITRIALMHLLEHASGRVYPMPSRDISRRCFFRERVICSTDNPNMRCCLLFDKKPNTRSMIIISGGDDSDNR